MVFNKFSLLLEVKSYGRCMCAFIGALIRLLARMISRNVGLKLKRISETAAGRPLTIG